MNKKIGIMLGAALLVFLLIGASSAGFLDFLGGDNASADNDDSTLVVGFDAEFPPYGYKDDSGEYTGFDLELAQEVCDRNNWTLVKQPIDWDAKDAELDSGSIDCIWNGFTINGREDDYTWTKPYINNKQVIVVKADSGIKVLPNLKDKIVETQKDSSALAALEGDQKQLAATFKTLTQVADYNTAFMDLESGACDAVAMDIGVAQHEISSKDNPADYYIIPKEISSEQYGVGFKKGNEQLRDQVQKTLDEMFEDGTVMKIAQKYADSGVPGSLIVEDEK